MYKLRSYQQEAIDKTISYFQKQREPAVIVLPTGAGKSLVIAELARIARGRVLVLAHVKELVEQNHKKFISLGLEASIYSAGLGRKESNNKVVFGSIQSVANADLNFFADFTILIIDECHRISIEGETQYQEVIKKITESNPKVCILGLTATPYRVGLGWIYQYSHQGILRTGEPRFFKHCIFELPLEYMIKNGYLTRPIKIDIPVTCYDFSELTENDRLYSMSEVEELLKKQKKLTPLIIKNIIDITEQFNRTGVMIFASTVNHAKELLTYLPADQSRLIIGDTESHDRDEIIKDFKNKKIKYLVNVSVLTTGFDAPHVDVIAILRPTESISLYQQIIGRGLRLSQDKQDCFILDYTGMGHNIYTPEIGNKRPSKESVAVEVICPQCNHINNFWGLVDFDGDVIEHYGRKCQGAIQDPQSLKIIPCNFRFRFKLCHACGEENDLTAKCCTHCKTELVDAESKLKQARLSKNAHVFTPDTIEFLDRQDRNNSQFLEVKYYDFDGNSISEYHYLNGSSNAIRFEVNFLRIHNRRPEQKIKIKAINDVLQIKSKLRMPKFIIARKQDKFWKITEKIFIEEL